MLLLKNNNMTHKKEDELKELMEKSGNSFHSRVVNLLRNLKWKVLVSPYYSDGFTDKPRELDIITGKDFDINAFIGSWLGTLNIRFFIECKYVNKKTIFWFDVKDKERSIERIMTDSDLDHPQINVSIQTHHYFIDTLVAKLFTTDKGHGEDNEIIGKAINQNLNAMIYYRYRSDVIPPEQDKRTNVLRNISYPLIVVNSFDNFYKTDMSDENYEITPITEPFQIEVNYAYVDKDKNSCNEYFLIDVVSFEKLPEFLSKLEENDVKIIINDLIYKEGSKSMNRLFNESRTGGDFM